MTFIAPGNAPVNSVRIAPRLSSAFAFPIDSPPQLPIYPLSAFFIQISDQNKIWVLCLVTIVKDKCNNIKLTPNNKILIEKNIPGMRMTLISKK